MSCWIAGCRLVRASADVCAGPPAPIAQLRPIREVAGVALSSGSCVTLPRFLTVCHAHRSPGEWINLVVSPSGHVQGSQPRRSAAIVLPAVCDGPVALHDILSAPQACSLAILTMVDAGGVGPARPAGGGGIDAAERAAITAGPGACPNGQAPVRLPLMVAVALGSTLGEWCRAPTGCAAAPAPGGLAALHNCAYTCLRCA